MKLLILTFLLIGLVLCYDEELCRQRPKLRCCIQKMKCCMSSGDCNIGEIGLMCNVNEKVCYKQANTISRDGKTFFNGCTNDLYYIGNLKTVGHVCGLKV